jgi:hypothetical protein
MRPIRLGSQPLKQIRANHGTMELWFALPGVGLTVERYRFFAGTASVVGEVTKPSVSV